MAAHRTPARVHCSVRERNLLQCNPDSRANATFCRAVKSTLQGHATPLPTVRRPDSVRRDARHVRYRTQARTWMEQPQSAARKTEPTRAPRRRFLARHHCAPLAANDMVSSPDMVSPEVPEVISPGSSTKSGVNPGIADGPMLRCSVLCLLALSKRSAEIYASLPEHPPGPGQIVIRSQSSIFLYLLIIMA